MIGLEHYLIVSAILFGLGLMGVVMRSNLIVIYMSLELMLNAANLALVFLLTIYKHRGWTGHGFFRDHGGSSRSRSWFGVDRSSLPQAANIGSR